MSFTIEQKLGILNHLTWCRLLPKRLKGIFSQDPWKEIKTISDKPWYDDYRWEVDPVSAGFLQTPQLALWWASDMMEGSRDNFKRGQYNQFLSKISEDGWCAERWAEEHHTEENGRTWKPGSKAQLNIAKDAGASARYAIMVLKQPFPLGEEAIIQAPDSVWAREYDREFKSSDLLGKWRELHEGGF